MALTQPFIPFTPNPHRSSGELTGSKMSDPKERFFRHFQAQVTLIQDQINGLAELSPVNGERKDCTDTILTGISRLSNEVMDAGDYIPAYDQRTYSQAIKALTDKLNETNGKTAPKSRFQFKNRSAKQQTGPDPRLHNPVTNAEKNESEDTEAVAVQETDDVGELPSSSKNYNYEMARQEKPGVRKPSFSTAKNISIFDQTGLHIILPSTASRATSAGSLTNLSRCIVDMTIPTSTGAPFAGLALKNIKDSLIVAGQVAGAAHITGLANSVVVVSARQVRIHECTNVQLYLHSSSHPIIEDCSGMRFAPLPNFYQGNDSKEVESNQWDQVDDFKWLKSEPSPNWSTLPEDQRVTEDTWKNIVCGNPSFSTDDILRKVGVLASS
ncbi:TBCC-domain-containing protein [Xylariomycetidae sp. FL0641]|nr:TBCC-domain-containing protein [Xylariomycetidae sp. FL0641]